MVPSETLTKLKITLKDSWLWRSHIVMLWGISERKPHTPPNHSRDLCSSWPDYEHFHVSVPQCASYSPRNQNQKSQTIQYETLFITIPSLADVPSNIVSWNVPGCVLIRSSKTRRHENDCPDRRSLYSPILRNRSHGTVCVCVCVTVWGWVGCSCGSTRSVKRQREWREHMGKSHYCGFRGKKWVRQGKQT